VISWARAGSLLFLRVSRSLILSLVTPPPAHCRSAKRMLVQLRATRYQYSNELVGTPLSTASSRLLMLPVDAAITLALPEEVIVKFVSFPSEGEGDSEWSVSLASGALGSIWFEIIFA
jgi:hypothetical protein